MAFAYACALRADGTVWCWGGAEVDKTHASRGTRPRKVDGLAAVRDFDVGGRQLCALDEAGAVFCSSLARASADAAFAPPERIALPRARQVRTQGDAACAILDEPLARVFCWGSDSFGQLGDGTVLISTEPRALSHL